MKFSTAAVLLALGAATQHVHSHTVELWNCVSPNGDLRVFARGYHPLTESASSVGINSAIDGLQARYTPTGHLDGVTSAAGLTHLCQGGVEPSIIVDCPITASLQNLSQQWWWFDLGCDTGTFQFVSANTGVLWPSSRCASLTAVYTNDQCITESPTTSPTSSPTACEPEISCPADMVVAATSNCQKTVSIPAPTIDWKQCGQEGTWAQTAGPTDGVFGLGDTTVEFTATEFLSKETTSCSFTVTVEDQESLDPANLKCGGPTTIKPCDVPAQYTAAYSKDNGCAVDSVTVSSSFECQMCNGAGRPVDKTGDCAATVSGPYFEITDSGGVGDFITFTATVSDGGHSSIDVDCTVCVDNAQGGCGGGDRHYLRELQGRGGGGGGKFECPADWDLNKSFLCPA